MMPKTRTARSMPGNTTLVEPTSGNTGIAAAFVVCRGEGLQDAPSTMPESMWLERLPCSLGSSGADHVLTEGSEGHEGRDRQGR